VHILFVLIFPGSAEADVGRGKKTERSFDAQLCREYVYQELLKLDNPSSSYGKKLVCFYASQCIFGHR